MKNKMAKNDIIFGYITLGFIIFIMCFCMGWWSADIIKFNPMVGIIGGAILGIAIDIIVLKKMVLNLYELNYKMLIMLYIAYSIGIFGFFMGVPVFNIIMGIIAGYYIGRRMKIEKKDEQKFLKKLKNVNIFGLWILIVICAASAFIALIDPYTGSNLKGMLGLPFEVTTAMIWGIILIGGALLVTIQYNITKMIAVNTYNKAN